MVERVRGVEVTGNGCRDGWSIEVEGSGIEVEVREIKVEMFVV